MNQDEMKQAVAQAALEYIPSGGIVGVGTGSTANFFIDALATIKHKIDGTVASSEATAARLRGHGIEVLDLNNVSEMTVYIDGADEANDNLQLIKGGGGALTREKIVAAVADKFICIADDSKLVSLMGAFPLPVEVIPMARSHVAREIVRITGAQPVLRENFTTDNGNIILDIHGMQIEDPSTLEANLNAVTGVVTNGLFSIRPADVLLLGGENGVRTIS